jgi:cyclopropane fatty-acyl-phospholipid synthase-like methyltransferase
VLDEAKHQLLKTYISEAEFFETVLAPDLSSMSPRSHLVEVGSGIGLLAMNLAAKSFEVTAFEPQASGFTDMHKMRDHITANWPGAIPQVDFRDTLIDNSTRLDRPADYIFAINVIEHVSDYKVLISDALKLKTSNGVMRIICPNYAIPYEPHLELPIVFNKNLTWRIFKRRILNSPMDNPREFWQDLSWPSQRQLNKILKELDIEAEFSRDATNFYINRALSDTTFLNRKGRVIGTTIKAFAFAAKHLTRFIPISLVPIIDCRIT